MLIELIPDPSEHPTTINTYLAQVVLSLWQGVSLDSVIISLFVVYFYV